MAAIVAASLAYGWWMAVEAGFVASYAAEGLAGRGWAWVAPGGWGRGLLFVLIASACFAALIGGVAKLAGQPRKLPRFMGGLAAMLGAVEVLAMAATALPSGRWAAVGLVAVVLSGRVCAVLLLCEALRLGTRLRIAGAHLISDARNRLRVYGVLALIPIGVAPFVTMPPTGDEPSYISYAISMIEDGDLQFSPDEVAGINAKLGISPGVFPHLDTLADGHQRPRHYIGPSLVLLPFCWIADVTGFSVLLLCRMVMLCIYGVILCLMAEVAWRVTGRWGASLVAALLLGGCFPLIGMATQIYPDPMVALLVLVALLALAGRSGRAGGLRPVEVTVCAVVACLLPWFHGKFAVVSAVLVAGAVLAGRKRGVRELLVPILIVLVGAAVYLGLHWWLLGDFLWRQADTSSKPLLEGLAALLTDGHGGVLPYLPIVLMLPFGFRLLCTGGQRAMAALAVGVTLAIWIPAGRFGWESGSTALRYHTPAVVAWAPVLAIVAARAHGVRLHVLLLLLMVPAVLSWHYLRDPWSAYLAHVQGMRWLPDQVFREFSWRDLFGQFTFMHHGIEAPGRVLHGWLIVGACAVSAWGLSRAGNHSWKQAGWVVVCAAGLPVVSCLMSTPTWPVTGLRMFQRDAWLAMEYPVRFARPVIDLLPAIKPLERYADAEARSDGTLRFHAGDGDGWLLGLAPFAVPAGTYRATVVGGFSPVDGNSTGALELFVTGLDDGGEKVFRRDFGAGETAGSMEKQGLTAIIEGTVRLDVATTGLHFGLKRLEAAHVAVAGFRVERLGAGDD